MQYACMHAARGQAIAESIRALRACFRCHGERRDFIIRLLVMVGMGNEFRRIRVG